MRGRTGGGGGLPGPTGPPGEPGAPGTDASATHWIAIDSANYTAAPASTSTLTMTSDLTGTVKPGYGLKYTIGGTVYYGMVTAMASNLMTVAGAPLSGDVSNLYYTKTGIVQMPMLIPGVYGGATDATLILNRLGQTIRWQQGPAYLVNQQYKTRVKDTSSDGKINTRINGSDVCSTSGGITLSSTSWIATVVNVATNYYDINYGEEIELNHTAGTTKNGEDLSVVLTFVMG